MRRFLENRRRTRAISALALGLAMATAPVGITAQEPGTQEGPVERAGAQIDRLLRDLERNFRGLSAEVRQQFARARQQVEGLGVQARVYGRLHWDKALHQADLAVEAREDGVVLLHGEVADAESRRKAVQLTVDTIGVTGVIDRLRVTDSAAGETDDEPSPDRRQP